MSVRYGGPIRLTYEVSLRSLANSAARTERVTRTRLQKHPCQRNDQQSSGFRHT